MRRIAASRVYMNGNEFHNHVVELIDHRLANHYPLRGEIAMTEWLGGTIVVHEGKVYHTRLVLSPSEVASSDLNNDFCLL